MPKATTQELVKRVRVCVANGMSAEQTARSCGRSLEWAQYHISVVTGGPGPNDPSPEEIRARADDIRTGRVVVTAKRDGTRGVMPGRERMFCYAD
jgi:hypothetical protein